MSVCYKLFLSAVRILSTVVTLNMSDSDNDVLSEIASSKKRKTHGRLSDVNKHFRNHTFETSAPCNCGRFRCFEVINEEQRLEIIRYFNSLENRNAQNSYLCGLVEIGIIHRRRPRKGENEANLRDHSYKFKVRIKTNNSVSEIPVCQKAFISLHGITNRRLITIKGYLKSDGHSKQDQRGKHKNRPHKIETTTYELIGQHIKSFKGRNSHYSLNKSKRTYLPQDLNITKMWKLYNALYNNNKVSYDTYRKVFLNDFNIGFGYPRSDTCSFCDSQKVEVDFYTSQLQKSHLNDAQKRELQTKLKRLETEVKVHKTRANVFYDRKRAAKKKARKEESFEAITMDFSKNLPTPNIATNDVYYKRQLTFISFNIHVLSNGEAIFYTYPQTIAKKGADDVTSLMYHFCFNYLPESVRHLEIYCDSCSGQNKNYTMFRFLHFLVHGKKRFDTIKVTFPIRGHSYLECDKDFGLINQKAVVEIPDQWVHEFEIARAKPTPFKVISCSQEMFLAWTAFLTPYYKKTSPLATRPVKEIFFNLECPRTTQARDTYNGSKISYIIIPNKNNRSWANQEPLKLYNQLIPVPIKKYTDLQNLKRFVSQENQTYYLNLPVSNTARDSEEETEVCSISLFHNDMPTFRFIFFRFELGLRSFFQMSRGVLFCLFFFL